MKSRQFAIAALVALLMAVALPASAQDAPRPDGWTEDSHSNDAGLNYGIVFAQDAVNTMTITIAPETWQAMLDDMTELAGEFGAQQGRGMGGRGAPPEGMPPPDGEGRTLPPDGGGQRPGGMGGPGGNVDIFAENPMWAAVDIEMGGVTWTNVGMRFKGNSSLSGTWREGTYKLPFKLDFDEFEDDYPEIDNQRFYGFKQLSFSSNWSDDSLLREKVTADVFREAGVPAAQTAFYAVYVDYGGGPVYFGLYTAVEVIEDTLIQTQFADDGGNVYKPEGAAATFAAGTFDEDALSKENNEDEADFSDVQALYDALHAPARISDPAAWRAGLESVFDVDGFLLWLATNTVVQNWDTYGEMSHNYYLYNDPDSGLLTWIPWDNNMALGESFRRSRVAVSEGNLSFEKSGVDENWPLIRYLLDDSGYYAAYVQYVDEVSSGAFAPDKMAVTYTALHALIAPYVTGENAEQSGYTNLSSPEAFEESLAALIEHAERRFTAAQAFVAAQAVAP